jgi:hypothetical protein
LFFGKREKKEKKKRNHPQVVQQCGSISVSCSIHASGTVLHFSKIIWSAIVDLLFLCSVDFLFGRIARFPYTCYHKPEVFFEVCAGSVFWGLSAIYNLGSSIIKDLKRGKMGLTFVMI